MKPLTGRELEDITGQFNANYLVAKLALYGLGIVKIKELERMMEDVKREEDDGK